MAACKKVAFINGKGGVGKTTSIFHVAGVLSARGEKTLIIDLDKQRNTTNTFLMETEAPPRGAGAGTMFDFMKGTAAPEEAVRKSYFRSRGNASPKYYNIDVMPSDIRFEFEVLLEDIDIKGPLERFVQGNGYTWLLVDMPPSNRMLNEICFSQIVDFVIVPFSSDFYSLEGYSDLIDTVNRAREHNANLNIIGVYLARYFENCKVDKYIRDKMGMFGKLYMDIYIPVRVDIRESVMYGRPMSYYRRNSSSTRAYERLVDAMEQRIAQFRR
ncbi:MAG: ParA family protein [Clostridia bacterium]|nr:ParA family protein [Clostridia bacterium]